MQGLVRICRQCSDDATKDGIRGVAWNQLMKHHSQERDVRVLEAWKLAQVSGISVEWRGINLFGNHWKCFTGYILT